MDVTVTLPDGANKDTFKSTIESSCSDMYGGVTGATVACPTSVTLTTVPAELESGGDAGMVVLWLVLGVGGCIFLLFLLKVFEVDDWLQERGGVKCALMLVVGGVVLVAVIRWIGDALGGMDTGLKIMVVALLLGFCGMFCLARCSAGEENQCQDCWCCCWPHQRTQIMEKCCCEDPPRAQRQKKKAVPKQKPAPANDMARDPRYALREKAPAKAMAQLKSVRSPRSPLPWQTTHPPTGLSATVWTD